MGLKSRKWESELLELFEVEEEKLCRLTEPGSISGTVTAEFSQKTGIPAGIPLISAGGDQQCGALGQGLLEEGTMTVTLGTSACILKCAGSIPEELNGVICGAHAIPRRFVLEGSMLTCGATFDWVRRTFFSEGDFTAVNQAVSASPPGANGVIVLPYFQGRGTPDWNSGARGGFLNLSLSATRADMVWAALEAVVYEIVNEIEIMEAMGPTGDTIRAGGGATNSLAFCGMLADASGKTVLSGDNTEGTAFGAWMNAAVTLGVCADYAEAFGIAGEETARSTTRPRPENYRIYSIGRERMNEMYLKLGLV